MRKRTVAVASAVLLAGVAAGGIFLAEAAGKPGVWKGIVTDDQCAKSDLAKANDAACPQHCVANGAKFALYDTSSHKVYVLSPQEKMTALAGRKVTIRGALEGGVIRVANIAVTPKN